MKKFIATILLTATATTAYADDDVNFAAEWLNAIKDKGVQVEPDDFGHCHEAIAAARKAGKTRLGSDNDFNSFGGKDGYITLEQGESICREAIFYRDVVRKDLAVFAWFNGMAFAMMERTNDLSYYKTVEEHADACDKAVDALLAAKVDPATRFKVGITGHMAQTIAEIKPNVCDYARAEAKRIYKDRTEKADTERAPYVKAGIAGDKLDFVLKNDDGSIWLSGKREAVDAKALAKASTMFLWTTGEPDGWNYVVHDVYKYVFKGNNLVKTTSKSYRTKYGVKLGAAAFK
jgi:hypothetical protein